MKRIYLVRHGESEANVARVNGGAHHALTDKGLRQAKVIAERCSHLEFQALFASDMVRARQTAEAIGDESGLPVQTSALFRELRGPSSFMERPVDDPQVVRGFFEINSKWGSGYRHSDEETFEELKERSDHALDLLVKQEADAIVVVSHSLFSRVLLARVLFGEYMGPRECLQIFYSAKLSNTGLTVFEYQPTNALGEASKFPWQLVTWNDHAHLAD